MYPFKYYFLYFLLPGVQVCWPEKQQPFGSHKETKEPLKRFESLTTSRRSIPQPAQPLVGVSVLGHGIKVSLEKAGTQKCGFFRGP